MTFTILKALVKRIVLLFCESVISVYREGGPGGEEVGMRLLRCGIIGFI